ncbi:sugar phosphate isomerase/epimerase family protein [Quadrisphaera sp. KR29]|uniref:sugar phosphate isomerase/epimerase family protein n=1 Tax=Quadrisphaera sp. KR29 TaxID=3461391 RepID=UPI004044AF6C
MQLSMVTDSLGHLSLDQALDVAVEAGLDAVEIATGNWSQAPHADLEALASDTGARRRLAEAVTSRGLRLCALNANGNQLHPVEGARQDRVVRQSITAAAEMGVPTVVLMSGLPAGAAGERTPNWVTTSWPPETQTLLAYQWERVALPYWEDLAAFAAERGVRLAVEMHGNQLVYNPLTLARLRAAVDPAVVGANLDPSHLMWMGADILEVVRDLGGAVFHVHAKDVRLDARNASVNGRLDTLPPERARERSWNFVTLGLGHEGGAGFWAQLAYALRGAGYDGPISIEHEDVMLGSREGVLRSADLLRAVLPREAPDWRAADI